MASGGRRAGWIAAAIVLGVSCRAPASGSGEVILVSDGHSAHSLYVADGALATVSMAARELQAAVEIATGVKLAVTNEPGAPMICFGDNAAARQAGFRAEELPLESYRIAVTNGNVYILGRDVPTTQDDGASCGTLYGAYEFLERFLDARWLMPGPLGEDIPALGRLAVPEGVVSGGTPVLGRVMPYIQEIAPWRYPDRPVTHPISRDVETWAVRNRLGSLYAGRFGGALRPRAWHVWETLFSREALTNLPPEYFALVGGRRAVPDDKTLATMKFCTTHPDLIQAFAGAVMAGMEKQPDKKYFSISPSDGYGFCQCGTCRALDEPCDWPGWKALPDRTGIKSLTRRMLTFYNAVARIVGRRHPDKVLCGLVYDYTTYPPLEPMAIEPNLFLLLAPAQYYGGGLHRPEVRAEVPDLVRAWNTLSGGRLGYYDLPNVLMDGGLAIGAPQPLGADILDTLFSVLSREQVRYLYLYGREAWGWAGMHNYVLARLMWNPSLRAQPVADEWLRRAYGPAAAASMGRLYALLEAEVGAYKRGGRYDWKLTPDLVKKVYVPKFPDLERLYGEALAADQTDAQRERLELFGDNLVLLHWNLRKAGWLQNPETSVFYRSDEAFRGFAEKTCNTLGVSYIRPPSAVHSAADEFMRPKLIKLESGHAAVPRRPASVPAPEIDGDLSDPFWERAVRLDAFLLPDAVGPARQRTEARMAYDDACLYLALRCVEDRMPELRAACAARDDASIFQDDCIDLFLQPAPEPDPDRYWHVALNSRNAVWDDFNRDLNRNLPLRSAVALNETDWTAELAIPWPALWGETGAPAGRTWRGNLCRQQKPGRELSAWSPVSAHVLFCDPDRFGTWYFAP